VGCLKSVAASVAEVLCDFVRVLRLDEHQAHVAASIMACRTGRLGGHRALCPDCHSFHYAYHSCRNRHCPTCGHLDQALWAEAQLQELLPVSYFHVIFTVPASLRPFFRGDNRALALNALFKAVSETLSEAGASRGVRFGILAVLHTWTQKLKFHPHVHCLVTGGGLGPDGFVHHQRYLLPRKVLQILFKAKLLSSIQALHREGHLHVARHSGYELLRDASLRKWNVEIRKPLTGPRQVVQYFARYTRRIAISNSRIVSYDHETVAFRWRDSAHGNRQKVDRLDGETFAKRFLQHVLPPRFVRIRRYGLLSNRLRKDAIEQCRKLLDVDPPPEPPLETRALACLRIFGRDPQLCPKCKKARMVIVATWRATRRSMQPVIHWLLSEPLCPT